MKKILLVFILGVNILMLPGCKKEWLERKSKTIVTNDQVWNDPKQIVALLANFYDRIPTEYGLTGNWRGMSQYDEAMWSGYTGEDWRNNIVDYPYDWMRSWDYGLIRDINLSLEGLEKYSTELNAAEKNQFASEFRFVRAYLYFEMARRMGGVPLVTKQLIYDYSGDPTPLQQPRAKESEVYDFVASEVDAIKNSLGNAGSVSRANKYTALALKSRAMLYAGSLAKYNNLLPSPITTPGGEVGIPASRATDYYQKSLEASKEIINSGAYTLYNKNPHKGENFYEAVTKKAGNTEVIFVKDYLTSKSKKHTFSYDNIVRSLREDNLGSSCITPGLGLVEAYDYTDGSSGVLRTRTSDNSDYIYYDDPVDIFANKDGRLYGTIIYPGTTFKGASVQIQAGVKIWDAAGNKYNTREGADLGLMFDTRDGGDGKLLTGAAGPNRSMQEVTNTGFYLRKFIDAGGGTATRGIQSDMWWVWFRLGEIYLNATEAAFELGQVDEALTYINPLRQRAGITVDLTASTLTIDKIRNEFRVELAFEDHRIWDLKRWRIAHVLWNGDNSNPAAQIWALYPYRVIRPGDPRDGKYVFEKLKAPRLVAPRFFRMGNYYASIDQGWINNNPKLVRNPFH